MPFAGFDLARYPGDTIMQSLWDNSNLMWVGYYLAVGGAGLGDKQTWNGKFNFLKKVGWGVAPIYVGKQPTSQKLALKKGSEELEGYMDGTEAATLSSQQGIPPRSVIYFDLEMPTGSKPWLLYYFGWTKAMLDQSFAPGLYCSYLSARSVSAFLRERDPKTVPEIWAFNVGKFRAQQSFKDVNDIPAPDPADSGGAGATSWQYVQGSSLSWEKHHIAPVDFNSSAFSDPGTRAVSPVTT